MQGKKVLFRKPLNSDIDDMFNLLDVSLLPFTSVNEVGQKNSLIVSREVVAGYVTNEVYFTILAEANHTIIGWLSGSNQREVLHEHSCTEGTFYIEEIVVDLSQRRRGIGTALLNVIPEYGVDNLVVDTPLMNETAITFYRHLGFSELKGLPASFNKKWIRMTKSL